MRKWIVSGSDNRQSCSRSDDCYPTLSQNAMWEELDAGGTLVTITAGGSPKRHFEVSNAAYTLTLKWLKLMGGDVGSNGGSIYMSASGTIHATLCWFHDNTATGYGGSISADHSSGSTITLIDTVLTSNTASYGGAVHHYYGVLTFTRGRVENNTGTSGGGGLYIRYLPATITDVLFKSNIASEEGGAVRLVGYNSKSPGIPGSMTVTRCSFEENQISSSSTTYGGGAVFAYYDATVVVRESLFYKNKAANEKGHHLATSTTREGYGTPSVTFINTQFVNCDACASNNYYSEAGVLVETCSSSPCSVAPFTGTCTNRNPSELGVMCGCSSAGVYRTCACPPGQFSATGTPPCQTCPPGNVTNTLTGTGATNCTACAAGTSPQPCSISPRPASGGC